MEHQLKLLTDLAEASELIISKEAKRAPERRKWNDLPRALELVQRILVDGTLRTDFLGKPECRTFVLNENDDNNESNLFGSANIEAWVQLQMFNKVELVQLYAIRFNLISL